MDDDARRLIDRLREQGASEDELEEAQRAGSLGPLALELALRGPGETVSFEQAAAQAGLELDDAARLWRALGFPDPRQAPTRVGTKAVETLRMLSGLSRSLFGQETAMRLARVIGGSAAQIAAAIVDAFRIDVEMPQRDQGKPASEVVEDYTRIATAGLPVVKEAIGDVLIGHLLAVARARWALDEQRAAVTRELAVGFADLVGYTSTTRGMAPAELASSIDRFESGVAEIVSRHRGRVVKLIGDEVMFVVEDASEVAALCLELTSDDQLPEVRVGVAAGPVVALGGDYYGDVVNLAARLVKAARPGTALVAESIPGGGEPLELAALKGYEEPVRAYEI